MRFRDFNWMFSDETDWSQFYSHNLPVQPLTMNHIVTCVKYLQKWQRRNEKSINFNLNLFVHIYAYFYIRQFRFWSAAKFFSQKLPAYVNMRHFRSTSKADNSETEDFVNWKCFHNDLNARLFGSHQEITLNNVPAKSSLKSLFSICGLRDSINWCQFRGQLGFMFEKESKAPLSHIVETRWTISTMIEFFI